MYRGQFRHPRKSQRNKFSHHSAVDEAFPQTEGPGRFGTCQGAECGICDSFVREECDGFGGNQDDPLQFTQNANDRETQSATPLQN